MQSDSPGKLALFHDVFSITVKVQWHTLVVLSLSSSRVLFLLPQFLLCFSVSPYAFLVLHLVFIFIDFVLLVVFQNFYLVSLCHNLHDSILFLSELERVFTDILNPLKNVYKIHMMWLFFYLNIFLNKFLFAHIKPVYALL